MMIRHAVVLFLDRFSILVCDNSVITAQGKYHVPLFPEQNVLVLQYKSFQKAYSILYPMSQT